ncbi:MAG: O-phosphoserine--tRNA ligase [Candidatus Aenigmarchaeota archaeon]|nr:O-phosphoserine--tRNA ligase [Candidatus Aenigmarchaeota archaeon]
MKLNIKEIKESAKKDFEETWVRTSKLLPKKTKIIIKKRGEEHPFRKMVNKLRKIFLDMGFDEMENPTILPAEDVYKQYGPEAAVILDRAFFLAKLPRPEIGLSNKKIAQIEKIIGKFDQMKLKEIFRKYKKGEIESDDMTEEIVTGLNIKAEQATSIIDLFQEFKKLKPVATNLTLRSHMSATWYHTLSALQNKRDFPIALFSVGPRYRNEQKEDATHLRVHSSASVVLMDPDMSMDAGREITKKITKKLGFENAKFVRKKATSKYYAAGQEEEVFVKYKGRWFEIGDIGMYSPISLANFGIEYPVFNLGLGVERLVMILEHYDDIRTVVFPQFYLKKEFSDREIAKSIYVIEKPKTETGKEIAKLIEKVSRKYKDRIAPVEFIAWKGEINNKKILVKILESEEGKSLIGPAGFNKIFVKNKSIIGGVKKQGVGTGLNYMAAIANKVAHDIENKNEDFEYKVKIVRSLSDINLAVPKAVGNYIKEKQKKIDIRGPVFVTIRVEMRG